MYAFVRDSVHVCMWQCVRVFMEVYVYMAGELME